MKYQHLFIYILFLFIPEIYCQESTELTTKNSSSVFIETTYQNWAGEAGLISFIPNFETLTKAGKNNYISFSLGAGPIIGIIDYYGTYFLLNIEGDILFGKQKHFFETGAGVNLINTIPMIKFRLGYRLNTGRRFLMRVSYTPQLGLIGDDAFNPLVFSISVGYRFGGNSKK